jgi:hypothetical protein
LGSPDKRDRKHFAAQVWVLMDPVERFFSRVRKGPGCWQWVGAATPRGYGKLSVNNKLMYAHRFSYLHHKGELDAGKLVCHTCDNPSCVNPDHLFQGTSLDNSRDMSLKGRAPKGRLSESQVAAIRRRYSAGETAMSVAKDYGCSDTLVYGIAAGRFYRGVGGQNRDWRLGAR